MGRRRQSERVEETVQLLSDDHLTGWHRWSKTIEKIV